METSLIFAQTAFYLSLSFTIIGCGIFLGIVMYHFSNLMGKITEILQSIAEASETANTQLHSLLLTLSTIPILSFFFKKPEAMGNKKGRKNK